jgi:hypothetical protein
LTHDPGSGSDHAGIAVAPDAPLDSVDLRPEARMARRTLLLILTIVVTVTFAFALILTALALFPLPPPTAALNPKAALLQSGASGRAPRWRAGALPVFVFTVAPEVAA